VASSTEHALTAIAGINSSDVEQQAGRNEHWRTFRITLPQRKRKADGSPVEKADARQPGSQPLGKAALFKSANGPKNDTYQRVLRVSPTKSKSEARIAVVASGLAPENEVIVVQPVSNALTSTIDEISRISLGKAEAADADVISIEGNGHSLAYCTNYTVYVQQLPRTKGSQIGEPIKIYEQFAPATKKSKFRAMRFVTPHYIILLQNTADRTGASLLVLKLSQDFTLGQIILRKQLSKTTKSTVGLDVCNLSANEQGEFQAIVAVAGQDSSIELLTLEYKPSNGIRRFTPYAHLPSVHSGPLTRVVFSTFLPPATPIPEGSNPPGPQSVRLASVGVDQTVVLHTLRLSPTPPTSRTPRYTLTPSTSNSTLQTLTSTTIAIFVITLVALLMQAFCEIRGAVPPTLNAASYLPARISSAIVIPYYNATSASAASAAAEASVASIISALSAVPSSIPTTPSLSDLQSQLSLLTDSAADSADEAFHAGAIVVRDAGDAVSAELRHGADVVRDETVKKWEELTEREKRGWREKLVEGGHWVEGQGEKVLKGVLFSELAGAVGAAAAEVLGD
jgi:glycyl-tRNA synthetase